MSVLVPSYCGSIIGNMILPRVGRDVARAFRRRGLLARLFTGASSPVLSKEYIIYLKGSFHGRSYHGGPDYVCSFCGALFWYPERVVAGSVQGNVLYNLCCRGGRVRLPVYK